MLPRHCFRLWPQDDRRRLPLGRSVTWGQFGERTRSMLKTPLIQAAALGRVALDHCLFSERGCVAMDPDDPLDPS
jgi:hypothetical protein